MGGSVGAAWYGSCAALLLSICSSHPRRAVGSATTADRAGVVRDRGAGVRALPAPVGSCRDVARSHGGGAMVDVRPPSLSRHVEDDLKRFQISEPGRAGRCRRHHWRIDQVEEGGEARERWTCTVCGRSQWRALLANQVGRRERFSRWSTLTPEDVWPVDPTNPDDPFALA